MSSDLDFPVFLFLAPLIVFGLLFRKCWSDRELLIAVVVGGIAGAISTIPVKFLAYPLVSFLLGIDLRELISSSEDLWMKGMACIGVVGPIEETAKLLAVLIGITSLGLQQRVAAIFLAAIASGLGFSLAENVDYYAMYGGGVLLIRGAISSSGHAVFSGFAGLAMARALPASQLAGRRNAGRGFLYMLGGLALASFLHGSFNLVAFGLTTETSLPNLFFALLFGVALLAHFWTQILILDVPQQFTRWRCSGCEAAGVGVERFCKMCGSRLLERESDVVYDE